MCVGGVTSARSFVNARGRAVDDYARTAATAAVGRACTHIYVFIAQAVTVIVAIIACFVIVRDLGTRVFATIACVLIQVEPILSAPSETAGANIASSSAPLARDRLRINVGQLRVAIVAAGTAMVRVVE